MSSFKPGDVILAPVRIGNDQAAKVRPAVVIGAKDGHSLLICPVTSRRPLRDPYVTLELDHFAKGGLSLFEESYLLLSSVCTLRPSLVVGKKGVLIQEKYNEIISLLERGEQM